MHCTTYLLIFLHTSGEIIEVVFVQVKGAVLLVPDVDSAGRVVVWCFLWSDVYVGSGVCGPYR